MRLGLAALIALAASCAHAPAAPREPALSYCELECDAVDRDLAGAFVRPGELEPECYCRFRKRNRYANEAAPPQDT